eukprot:3596319-Amphidinium_carterae.1
MFSSNLAALTNYLPTKDSIGATTRDASWHAQSSTDKTELGLAATIAGATDGKKYSQTDVRPKRYWGAIRGQAALRSGPVRWQTP